MNEQGYRLSEAERWGGMAEGAEMAEERIR